MLRVLLEVLALDEEADAAKHKPHSPHYTMDISVHLFQRKQSGRIEGMKGGVHCAGLGAPGALVLEHKSIFMLEFPNL